MPPDNTTLAKKTLREPVLNFVDALDSWVVVPSASSMKRATFQDNGSVQDRHGHHSHHQKGQGTLERRGHCPVHVVHVAFATDDIVRVKAQSCQTEEDEELQRARSAPDRTVLDPMEDLPEQVDGVRDQWKPNNGENDCGSTLHRVCGALGNDTHVPLFWWAVHRSSHHLPYP